MNELSKLLDAYYAARYIKEDDQRSIATGVLDMVKAEHAIEEFVAKQARIDELETMRDKWPTDQHSTVLGYIDMRIVQLSHPNQPKQEGGGE